MVSVLVALSWPASAREPAGLHEALENLADGGHFSGAVVVRGPEGVRFSRGYGMADPFTGKRFTPETSLDGASLAKPVTAAAVFQLARQGRLELHAPVRRYVAEYPHPATTVRHLLAHSGALPDYDAVEPIAGKTTSDMLRALALLNRRPPFEPGSDFAYCNLCYDTLALVVERVSGQSYQDFIDQHLFGPAGIRSSKVRPRSLAEWQGRAIGYRRMATGTFERFDSWEDEAFYGGSNIAFTAADLAKWGAAWWGKRLAPIRTEALQRATIVGQASGLSWATWQCAPGALRCHWGGHHEGFHHFVYWNAQRRIAVAMVSNNTLDPHFHAQFQRALIAFAEGRGAAARNELNAPLPAHPVLPGSYRFADGSLITLAGDQGGLLTFRLGGLSYVAYPVAPTVRYVPGLEVHLTGDAEGGLRWIGMFEEQKLARLIAG